MPVVINGSTGISGVDGSAGTPAFQGSDTNTGIRFGTDIVSLVTGGSDRLYIDSSGKLGVGSTSPSQSWTGGASQVLQLQGPAATITVLRVNESGGTYGDLQLVCSSSAEVGVYNFANGAMRFGTNGTERLRIDSSGRLLVGTSTARSGFQISTGFGNVTPVHQFEYNSQLYNGLSITHNAGANTYPAVLAFGKSRGSTAGSYTAVASGDGLGWLDFYGADGTNMVRAATISAEVDGTPGTNDMPGRLVFSTTADGASSPTERMRISAAGDVTINDTSTDAKLVVANGSERQVSFKINNTNSSPVGVQIRYGTDVNGAANRFIDCIGNATTRFLVFSNGNVQNTNNSYAGISDLKLKENIIVAGSQWDDIKALEVKKFNFIGDDKTQIGLIAQDVEQVCPGLIEQSADTDDEGNETGEFTKSVKYSVLYMKAVKALQEAMERIEQLEAKVAALEAA